MHAGPEHSVAATKSYTAELLTAYRLVEAVQGLNGGAHRVPAAAAATLGDSTGAVTQMARELAGVSNLIITGRGFGYPTAREAALKLMETCYLPTLAFSAADLRHGPFALLARDVPVLVLAPAGRTRATMYRAHRPDCSDWRAGVHRRPGPDSVGVDTPHHNDP